MLTDWQFWGVVGTVLGYPVVKQLVHFATGWLYDRANDNYPQIAPPLFNALGDYHEAVRSAVTKAEQLGIPGPEKLKYALEQMELWLDSKGIEGDAKTVTVERIRQDIELVRAAWFPSKKGGK